MRTGPIKCRPLTIQSLEGRMVMAAYTVTSAADDGPGSLRAGLERASSDATISAIMFRQQLGQIDIQSPLVYEGQQLLIIDGRGVTIRAAEFSNEDDLSGSEESDDSAPVASEPFDLFVSSGGGNLALSRLNFEGGARGIRVDVPGEATGLVKVVLREVQVRGANSDGLSIDDRADDVDDEGDQTDDDSSSPTSGIDSAAGISLTLDRCVLADNGGAGVRVEEGGAGQVVVQIRRSTHAGNGDAGFTIEEQGEGGVQLQVNQSLFGENGGEDRPSNGIEIEESDGGSLWASLVDVTLSNNSGDGLGVDESGEGDLRIRAVNSSVIGNGGAGIDASEVGNGSLFFTVVNGVIANNGDDAVDAVEHGAGSLDVSMNRPQITGNGGVGVKLRHQWLPADAALAKLNKLKLKGNAEGQIDAPFIEQRIY